MEPSTSRATPAATPATVEIDLPSLAWADQYKILSSTVIPRPIALVSTAGPAGTNAAPFSFFNAVAFCPPMLMISIGSPAGGEGEKHTLTNLRANGECVVHIVDDANKERMNRCAPEYPIGVNEIALAGFTTIASTMVQPPRIAELPVQYECRVHSIQPLGSPPCHLVLLEVVAAHIRRDAIDERHRIDLLRLNPIGRLSSPGMYTRITDNFRMDVPAI
ncbi:flavin reductase family protein [Ramlibacter sp. WS9]|uniref:flavin reductase family protein n=1 Tax=Ramlibacter sp. WS9 TaxID=1882741 RepID=UPI001143BC8F|nr:flavin reductase family protein [Ramlibacter sp. WS9]